MASATVASATAAKAAKEEAFNRQSMEAGAFLKAKEGVEALKKTEAPAPAEEEASTLAEALEAEAKKTPGEEVLRVCIREALCRLHVQFENVEKLRVRKFLRCILVFIVFVGARRWRALA